MKCSFIIGLKIIEAQKSFHKRERPQDIVTWIPVPGPSKISPGLPRLRAQKG